MLTVFGSLVLDTIHTPDMVSHDALGGSSTYAALAARLFTKTNLVAVAGSDLPHQYLDILSSRVDLAGLRLVPGKTFRYEARYENDFESRVDMLVEPNVSLEFQATLPEAYLDSDYVYLANTDPLQQMEIIRQLSKTRMVMCDTIGHWIRTKRDDVISLVGMVDATIMNDGEARLLTGLHNLRECARAIMRWGSTFVIIKKAEHGSLLFYEDAVYPLPGFPLSVVADPTGAGDSFAGAVMGYMDASGTAGLDGLRKACLYGNVLGSFTVEKHGVEALLQLTPDMVEARVQAYRDMISC